MSNGIQIKQVRLSYRAKTSSTGCSMNDHSRMRSNANSSNGPTSRGARGLPELKSVQNGVGGRRDGYISMSVSPMFMSPNPTPGTIYSLLLQFVIRKP
ncbi:hypothetical protein J6590_098542 [Homalodisca vitripennis]|nr:hypothetical protein J6590_029327 [Homalodisca vitripennis]KAG8289727.1 hypothetical protein J6590_098542 [Homalodisca vitripennis]